MAVTTIEIIRWILVLFSFIFHCSVTFFIFYMKYKKRHQTYQSTFYTLFLMLSYADTLTFFCNIYAGKAKMIDEWKPWFYEHTTLGGINWLISGYCIYMQSIVHVSIAINRVWVAFDMLSTNKKLEKIGRRAIWLLPLVPVCILSGRFEGTIISYYASDGSLGVKYVQPHVQLYHAVAGPTVTISTSAISFFLTLVTILRYRHLFKQHTFAFASRKSDFILFAQATATFLFQLTVTAYYVMILIAVNTGATNLQAFALWYYQYIIDAVSLFNPIALLLVCSFVRKDYMKFYFGCKIMIVKIAPSSSNHI